MEPEAEPVLDRDQRVELRRRRIEERNVKTSEEGATGSTCMATTQWLVLGCQLSRTAASLTRPSLPPRADKERMEKEKHAESRSNHQITETRSRIDKIQARWHGPAVRPRPHAP